MEIIERDKKKVMVLPYDEWKGLQELEEFKKSGGIGIVHASTGHDNIPITTCTKLGLKQVWLEGYSTNSVVELGLFFTLLSARTQKLFRKSKLSHSFCFRRGTELNDKTALVIGSLGRIGSGLIPILKALGMLVLEFDSKPGHGFESVSLTELLGKADYIYLCVNGEGNRKFFIKEYFQACKRYPVLINLVRKSIISERVLTNAINRKQISQYLIDDSLNNRFGDSLNVFSSNHVGANTVEAREKQKSQVVRLVDQMFKSN